MSGLRAILFDLDDTLYDEMAYVRSGFRAVAAWAAGRWPSPAEDVFRQLNAIFEAGYRRDTFDRWLAQEWPGETQRVREMIDIYRGHRPEITLSADVSRLLVRLRKRYRLAVVTDGAYAVQRGKLDALGLDAMCDAIVISDQWGRDFWKPHPRPYRAALTQLACPPAAAVFVGDNVQKDFLGARRAGLRSIRVANAQGMYQHERPPAAEYAPDAAVRSLLDLEPLLERWHFNEA